MLKSTNPPLRFRDEKGKEYPDWEIKKLGDVGEIKSGNSFHPSLQNNCTEKYPFIKVSDFNHLENIIYIKRYNYSVSLQTVKENNFYIFPKDTIVFAKVGEALRLNRKKILYIPTIIDNNLMGVSFNKYNNLFFMYYVLSLINISDYSNNGTLPSITSKQVFEIPISIPTIQEQEKIGNFLKAIDDKITIQVKKLEELRNYKKGLMQQLFPKANQTNPPLRFRDEKGKEYPDWEIKRLGDVGEISTGKTPKKSDESYYINGNIPWVTTTELNNKYITESKILVNQKALSQLKLLPVNSILITCIASIGKNAIAKVELTTNQQINAIVVNKNYDFEFIYYLINFILPVMIQYAGVGFMPIISKSLFESIQIPMPCMDEQIKIGNFLKSIDDKITIQTKKLEELKKYKQGLMQQLFPTI